MRYSKVTKKCLICNKKFDVIFYRRNTSKYCSKKCQGQSKYSKKMGERMKKIHLGQTRSIEWRKNLSNSKLGIKNPKWKGDSVGLEALHIWVTKRFPKTEKCQMCKKVKPYDLANISQKYKRDTSDWEWLCRKCHMIKDGRLNNFIKYKSKLIK